MKRETSRKQERQSSRIREAETVRVAKKERKIDGEKDEDILPQNY